MAFDYLGEVVILNTDKNLEENIKKILKTYPKIKAIYLKKRRFGEFRVQELELVWGKDVDEITCKESGCVFKLNPKEVFYSPRLSQERLRIAKLISPGEKVCVFFAGVGPFPIVISKHSKAEEIIGVEKNPKAYEYFLKNIELNKCKNVKAILGDVKDFEWSYKFDRILMPLPWESEKFLDKAIEYSKKYIHIYKFLEKEKIDDFKTFLSNFGKIISIKELSSYSKNIKEFVFDLEV